MTSPRARAPVTACIVLGVVLAGLTAACGAAKPPNSGASSSRHPASRDALVRFGDPYFGQSRTIGNYTYTTDLVEARLGRNRFRIPANFFYDQMGPDFQGSVRLVLIWPELAPTPPGVNFHDDPNLFDRHVSVSILHPDNVSVQAYMERMVNDVEGGDLDDPTRSLATRIAGDTIHGLKPYYTDFRRVDVWARRRHGERASVAADRASPSNSDWYVSYRPDGSLATHIACVSREVPDGITFDGARVVSAHPPIASCTHTFAVPAWHLVVTMDYVRPMLKDWKKMESRVLAILSAARIEPNIRE